MIVRERMALLANQVFGIVNMGGAVVRYTHNGHSATLYYRKSGNFRYMKFSLENFLCCRVDVLREYFNTKILQHSVCNSVARAGGSNCHGRVI